MDTLYSTLYVDGFDDKPVHTIFKAGVTYVSVDDVKKFINYTGSGHTFLSACEMHKTKFEEKGRAAYYVKSTDLPKATPKKDAKALFAIICEYFNPPKETSAAVTENVNSMPDDRITELFGDKKETMAPIADYEVGWKPDLEAQKEVDAVPIGDTPTNLLTDLQAEVVRLQTLVNGQTQELNRLRNYYRYADIDGDTLEITPIPGGGGIRIAHINGSDAVDFTDREEVGHLVNNINTIFAASIN